MEKALFAAGCFWGVQFYFDQVPGVVNSMAGYSGGHTESPSYEQVCTHTTGHAEVVSLEFDNSIVSYEDLCRHFFVMHDPTQLNRQGWDVGDSYRSAIFYFDDDQRQTAQMIKFELDPKYEKPIVTEISPAKEFYAAEDYHQKYTAKTGEGMCHAPYKPLEK